MLLQLFNPELIILIYAALDTQLHYFTSKMKIKGSHNFESKHCFLKSLNFLLVFSNKFNKN